MSGRLDALAARLAARAWAGLGDGSKRAAVAIVLRESPDDARELEVLLLLRAERAGDPWSGHVAFPGGRREPADVDDRAAAVRETLEEVGLDLASNGRHLGALDDVSAIARGEKTGLIIAPHVFALHTASGLTLQPSEVAAVRWVPLAPLLDGVGRTSFAFDWRGQSYMLPAFDVEGWRVWGLTYQMLSTLLDELRAPQK